MYRFIPVLTAFTLGCPAKEPAAGGSKDTGPSVDIVLPDEGCITINGQGGWATIGSALDWAEDGDTISLCAGTYEEKVVVEKSVTIKGPSDGEAAIIQGPPESSAVSVRADGAALSWLTVNADSSGIYVQDVDGVTLSVLEFGPLNGPAIRIAGSTNLTVQTSNFIELTSGAVFIDGEAEVTLFNNIFDGNLGYAVYAQESSALTLERNEVYGNLPNDEDKNAAVRVFDGVTLNSINNLYSGNTDLSISGSDADISSSQDTFSSGTYGIWSNGGSLTVDQAAITNPTVSGIRTRTTDGAISVTNSTITGDPETNLILEPSDWASGDTDKGVGIHLGSADTIVVEGVSISGFNHAGVFLDGTGVIPTPTTVGTVTIDNTGWVGVYAKTVDATVTDLSITNVRELDDLGDSQCSTIGPNSAFTARNSSVDWIGGTIVDNDGYGLAGAQAIMDVSGLTVSGNACAGIMNFQGTASVDDSDFSAPAPLGLGASVIGYSGDATSVTNSRFTDSGEIAEYHREVIDYGWAVYEYVYFDRLGNDIQFYNSGENTVTGNTFVNGASSVMVIDGEATVTDNSWSEYSAFGVYASNSTVTVSGASYTDSSGHIVACVEGAVTASDLTVDTTVSSSHRSYEVYLDGALSGSYPENNAFPSVYIEGCDTTISDAQFTDTIAMAMRVQGGTHTFDDLSVTRANKDSLYSSAGIELLDTWSRSGLYYEAATSVTFDNLVITENGSSPGLSFAGTLDSAGSVRSSVSMTDLNMTNSLGAGVTFTNVSAELYNPSISDTEGTGVSATGGALTIDGGIISGSNGTGVFTSETTLAVTDTFIQDSTLDGIYASGGTTELSENTIQGNSNNGVTLSGGTASLVDNLITTNDAYGVNCGSAEILACTNTIIDNGTADVFQCEGACGEEADADADADTDADSDADADADTDTGTEVDTDTGTEVDTDTGDDATPVDGPVEPSL